MYRLVGWQFEVRILLRECAQAGTFYTLTSSLERCDINRLICNLWHLLDSNLHLLFCLDELIFDDGTIFAHVALACRYNSFAHIKQLRLVESWLLINDGTGTESTRLHCVSLHWVVQSFSLPSLRLCGKVWRHGTQREYIGGACVTWFRKWRRNFCSF